MLKHNALRPALVGSTCLVLASSLTGCGELDEPVRFQTLAERISSIPVDGTGPQRAYPRTAEEAGLRPAAAPLQVTVMEPHAMWDARDTMVDAAVARAVPVVAPVATRAASEEIRRRVGAAMQTGGANEHRYLSQSDTTPLPPLRPAEGRPAAQRSGLIQLGAFSTYSAAQAAWSRLSGGTESELFAALSPVFEPVEVNGRQLVRLKVYAPAGKASQICSAARVEAPWCSRA